MLLLVEGIDNDKDAEEIGLTTARLQTASELRLRSARPYREGKPEVGDGVSRPFVYVNVNVVGSAYDISVTYKKVVLDLASGESNFATTWDTSSAGTHGRSGASFILSQLSQRLDEFLVEYLRVNEEHCGR